MIKGTLIPIGGNEDKGFHKEDRFSLDFISEGILAQVVNESGGKNATILVVTTASGIPKEVGKNYLEAFDKLGCSKATSLYINSREMADGADRKSVV